MYKADPLSPKSLESIKAELKTSRFDALFTKKVIGKEEGSTN